MGKAARQKHRMDRRREARVTAVLEGPHGLGARMAAREASGDVNDLLPDVVSVASPAGTIHLSMFADGRFQAFCHVQCALAETEGEVTCKRCLSVSNGSRDLRRAFAAAAELAVLQGVF